MKRVIALVALTAAVITTTTACGGATDSADPGRDKGSTEFTYWSMWQEKEPQAQVIKAAADSFTRDTGVKVTIQWHGRDVLKKLAPTLRGKAAADLVDQSINQLGSTLASSRRAADLGSVYDMTVTGEQQKVSEVIPAKYHPHLKDRDGRFYLVPYAVASEALWFNAARFPEFANAAPTNWEGFVAALDAVKAKGIAPLALDADNVGAAEYWPLIALIRAVGPDGMRKLAADQDGAAWDDPRVADAAGKLEHLVKGGYFAAGYDAGQYPAQQNAWAQGKAALILQGSWVPSESKSYAAPGFSYSSFQLPAINGGYDGVSANFFGFAIPRTARHGDAAGKFIAYFLNKSRLEGIATKAESITPREDIPAPASLESLQQALRDGQVYPTAAGIGLLYGKWKSSVLQPGAQALMQGRLGSQAWVAEMKRKTVEYWKAEG
ncbi:extracellular solute-binding protein [Pseudonocardiaceae bacterium YIM PH 21723]|nr:extracellular solute-binding protein [Pseudonocardiaceae bacterium YIM PH 21723]